MMMDYFFSFNFLRFFGSVLKVFVLYVGQNSLIEVFFTSLQKKMLKTLITKDAFSMYFSNLYLFALNLNFSQNNDLF